jgi:hypothetical protein
MAFILAIDYDGTLFEDAFPAHGNPKTDVIEKAKEFQNHGAEVILWTCRDAGALQEAIERCKEYGLTFDTVNSNSPTQAKYMQKMLAHDQVFATRKIFADLYVDDRSPGSIEFFLKIDVEKTCKKYEKRS